MPLFEALDGTRSSDYSERVEPSADGGARLAAILMDASLAGPEWADRVHAAATGGRPASLPAQQSMI